MLHAWVLCLLVSSMGVKAFSGHHDGKIRQWDLRSGEMVMDMEDLHTEKVTGLTLFPDSNRMVTCSRDNTLHIVDLRTRRSLFQLRSSSLWTLGLVMLVVIFFQPNHVSSLPSASQPIEVEWIGIAPV